MYDKVANATQTFLYSSNENKSNSHEDGSVFVTSHCFEAISEKASITSLVSS